MTVAEREFSNLISPYDVRDYKIATTEQELPEEFKLAEVTVKNQGSKSTCVAHACSSVIEYFNMIQEDVDLVFSTEFIYGYRPEGYYVGEGMYLREALKTLQKVGVCPLELLRGNNKCDVAMKNVAKKFDEIKDQAYLHRISTYMRVTSEREIKEALFKYGYVLMSMPWYKNYKLKNGIYTYSSDEKRGNHAVVIYGWNKDGWLVQNSWGKTWGKNGRFILPYDFKFNEAWSVTDEIINGSDVIKPVDKWYIKWFGKLINAIMRLLDKHQ